MDIFIKGKNHKLCVYTNNNPVILKEEKDKSDNQCEWLTLVEAMLYISKKNDIGECIIHTDSVLLYRQLTGVYRIKSKNLKPIYFRWNKLKNELRERTILYAYCEKTDNPARGYVNEN